MDRIESPASAAYGMVISLASTSDAYKTLEKSE